MTLVQVRYAVTFDAPFHLGTGISAGLVDRTIIRNASGYLYMPASTLKGVVREHCEQLHHFYRDEPHKEKEAEQQDVAEQEPDTRSSVPSPHDARAALLHFGGPQTLVHRIFGSPLYPGGLHFNDAEQIRDQLQMYEGKNRNDEGKGAYKSMQTSVLTQVRIDRQTRSAVEQALYTSEFGIPRLTFEGTIKGQLRCTPVDTLTKTLQDGQQAYTLTPSYSLLLLLAGLLLLERIGGNKSTGKGQCRCSIEELLLDRRPCPEQVWHEWIAGLDVISTYINGQAGGQM